jgi:hypothetical protein
VRIYPLENLVQIPRVLAALEIHAGNPAKALELLEPGKSYERVQTISSYVRALAYFQMKSWREAAAEFEKIIDNRQVEPIPGPYHSLTMDVLAPTRQPATSHKRARLTRSSSHSGKMPIRTCRFSFKRGRNIPSFQKQIKRQVQKMSNSDSLFLAA